MEDKFCLCCENPPLIDAPGKPAVEATLKRAAERQVSDQATDPYEMEAE